MAFLTKIGVCVLGPVANRLFGPDISGFDRIDELAGKTDNSSWAALGLTGFSLLCLIGVTYLLYLVFSNAKSYFFGKGHRRTLETVSRFAGFIEGSNRADEESLIYRYGTDKSDELWPSHTSASHQHDIS